MSLDDLPTPMDSLEEEKLDPGFMEWIRKTGLKISNDNVNPNLPCFLEKSKFSLESDFLSDDDDDFDFTIPPKLEHKCQSNIPN